MFCTGIIHSALFSLGAVYAASMNFTIFEISLLLFVITVFGGVFQWPIGYYSDKSDRRVIIIICTFFAALFCVLAIFASGTSLQNMYLATSVGIDKIMFFVYVALYAGMAIPLFTLNLAYVNDYIPKEKFVAAGGGMQIIFGMGAMIGPLLCSLMMNKFGTSGFFVHLLSFHLVISTFGLYRMTKRSYEDNPESTFTPLPRNITPLGIELDPTTGADISSTENK
jgi:MFS family permease